MSLASPEDVVLKIVGAAGFSRLAITKLLAPLCLPIAIVEM
jgi:hypothetical protein